MTSKTRAGPSPGRTARAIADGSTLHILHLIERLTLGGPLFATAGLVKHSRAAPGGQHRLVSLLPTDARATEIAQRAGIDVLSAPPLSAIDALVAAADIVQIHFWNSPALHAWLNRGLGPCRLLVWCHVNGAHPPQVIPMALVRRAARLVATTALTLDLPQFQAARREQPGRLVAVPGGADFSRLAGFKPRPHPGFRVGFIGRVEASKLHPDFAAMCARLQVPALRIVVRGDGQHKAQLLRQVSELGIGDRFSFEGHAEDIRRALADLDVLGYPLQRETFCTSELVVQEAMHAEIPPVLMAHGGPARLVTSGRNGLVVGSADEYVAAIEALAQRPDWRRQLGRQAGVDARARLGAAPSAARMDGVYEQLCGLPKQAVASLPGAPCDSAGAWALITSLDGRGDEDLRRSLNRGNDDNHDDNHDDNDAGEAERRLAACGPALQDAILQYRLFYPADRHLRLWSGLALASRKRWALAAGELLAARSMGCGRRVDGHLDRIRQLEAGHA
jgi:glycosyltransferase involved in cell wall biosynthesis